MADAGTAATGTEIPPARAAELAAEGAQVVDVRGDGEHEAGHVAGARHIRLDLLSEETSGLDRERPVVFYCRSGQRSSMAADAFRASGWDAYHVDGGLLAWAEAGLPLEPADGEVAERPNLPEA
jgi:rhodanese-related sulfurtransferase